jgi:hypothetical protein
MYRDDEEYTGDIPANFSTQRPGEGLDPNHRGGYMGMRTEGGAWQSEYARYRAHHSDDLGGYGGFWGLEEPSRRPPVDYGAGSGSTAAEGGGVQDSFADLEYLKDFNADSPALAEPAAPMEPQAPSAPFGINPGYANRGLAGGYSQGWLGATAKPRGPSPK